MEKVKSGQLSELSCLFRRYGTLLYNFFLKLTGGDRAASEDLVQTVFYRILRFRHTFQSKEGAFRSWMYSTARHVHADHCRQKVKMSLFMVGNAADKKEPELPAGGYDEEQYTQLGAALSRLGAVDRELIVLSRYEGLKYADIARIKGTTPGAVKVQVHRAMKQLRLLYFNKV